MSNYNTGFKSRKIHYPIMNNQVIRYVSLYIIEYSNYDCELYK